MSARYFRPLLIAILIAVLVPAFQTVVLKKIGKESETNRTIEDQRRSPYDDRHFLTYANLNSTTGNVNVLRPNEEKESDLNGSKAINSDFRDANGAFGAAAGGRREGKLEKRDIADAVDYGVRALEELIKIKEPYLYKLGLVLRNDEPAIRVAHFGAPNSPRALLLARFGYATLQASRRIAQSYSQNVGRQAAGLPADVQSRIDLDECPLRGEPRCPPASRRFRTSDGTCNNFERPWRGSAMLPMHRFLPPVYEDGIQSVRRSVFGGPLPSPRQISATIHRDRNQEIRSVTLMFMQWGQFLDHDITSTVKITSFNGSIPRCCDNGGANVLPLEFMHPSCMPILVPLDDPFFSRFGIGCMEFLRSAPSTRIDCELGWREQINQATAYIDASMIYGSSVDVSDSIRTFRNGNLFYGRAPGQSPPDPPEGELCRAGALTETCFQPGDGRVSENPGLVAMHTIFVRYHNKVATVLSQINPHWSDERTYQETRRIVYSAIQHITYREYLPLVLGPEVMDMFELRLLRDGYYDQYDSRVNPAIANAFSTAAFRFGHSMVQNSFVRTDSHHVPLPNNVSLHEEPFNFENMFSFGSLDRFLLGLSNQPAQKRDEFMAEELTNHLFQFAPNIPFGMDLAAINIQRGRDHGLPPYTSWRKPCGLSAITNWRELEEVMSTETVSKLRRLYIHVDDIDLFTAGLAERPVRGAVVGPTFACIIAQQFLSLRKGDRFWYENEGFESSFSPAQLQQIRKVSLAQIVCQTMNEVETIQPFVFLSPDSFRNRRVSCDSPDIRNFDLAAWIENSFEFNSINNEQTDFFEVERSQKDSDRTDDVVRQKRQTRNKKRKKEKPNVATTSDKTRNDTISIEPKYGNQNNFGAFRPVTNRPNQHYDDVTYLFGVVERTTKPPTNVPLQVNINIHYALPTTATTSVTSHTQVNKKRRPLPTTTAISPLNSRPTNSYGHSDAVLITRRPATSTRKPETVSYPTFIYSPAYQRPTSASTTGGQKRPNYNGLTASQNTYQNSNYRPTSSFGGNAQQHPTYVQHNQAPSRPIFEDRPFSGSNLDRYPTQRPGAFNHYYNDDDDVRDSVVISGATYYNRDDQLGSTDDILDEFFQRHADKSTTANRRRPSISTGTNVNDKLDFTSRVIYNKDTANDDGLVQIGSVKKEVFGREGDDYVDNAPEALPKKKRRGLLRILDINATPSEPSGEWKYFAATEDVSSNIEIPELPLSVPCSYEVPKPMADVLVSPEDTQIGKSR